MKTIKKTIGWGGLAVATVLSLVSCGGSTGAAALEGEGACNTTSAKPGESVTCSVKGFQDGCTVFVGNTPVAAEIAGEGEVTFELPKAPAGFVDILYGCGADAPQTIQKKFKILPYFDGESGDGGDSGEVILPEEPEAPLPTEPEAEEPTTPGKDLVVGGELSAGPGAGTGAVVSLAGTADVHATHLKMIRVRWKVSGDVQEAYLHAAFNRFSNDGFQDDPCGKIGGRYLAVNDDGNQFNDGSADAEAAAPYLTGKLCQNNADCAGLLSGSTPAADVGLKADVTPTKPQRVPAAKAPVCRIDLKAAFIDKGVTEGEFFTLSHKKEMRIVLVAKTQNGTAVTDHRTWKSPSPVVTESEAKVSEDGRKATIRIEYGYAVNSPRLKNCSEEEVTEDSYQKDGSGTYFAQCRIGEGENTIRATVYGIGGSSVVKDFKVVGKGLQASGDLLGPKPGLPKEFHMELTSEGGGMEHPDGSEVANGTCNKTEIRIFHFFNWEGQNVETVTVEGAGIDYSHSELPEGKDGFDAGYLKIYEDLGDQDGTWDAEMHFTIRVTFRDGTQESKTWHVDGWSCH
jgi:hypothetical protein